MAKNEVARKENGTPVYSEKDIAERISQGRRVVVEHVEDWANGVTVDRQVQEETVIREQEVVQKEVKPSHSEAVSNGMLAYHGRKAREERDELAEKNEKQAAEIWKLKRELYFTACHMTNKNISILFNRIVYGIISSAR